MAIRNVLTGLLWFVAIWWWFAVFQCSQFPILTSGPGTQAKTICHYKGIYSWHKPIKQVCQKLEKPKTRTN